MLEEVASNATEANARRGVSGFSIKISALPAAILTYITSNYPDKTITKAEIYPTFYEVTLSDFTKLKFDLKGQIIIDKTSNTTSTEIPVASLPLAISNYMKANFANNPIIKAEKDATGYEVTIDTGLKLEFNLDGTFREISGSKNNNNGTENGEHISTQALPAATLAYLLANYPNNPVIKAEKEASGYEVTLDTGLKLEFNVDGTFREISGSKSNSGNNSGSSNSGNGNSGNSNSGSSNSGNSGSGSSNSGSGNSGSSNSGSSNSGNSGSGNSNSGSSNSGSGNSGSSNSGSSNSGNSGSGNSNSGSSNSGSGNSGSSNSGSSNSGSGKDGGKDSGKSEKEKKGKG